MICPYFFMQSVDNAKQLELNKNGGREYVYSRSKRDCSQKVQAW